MRCSKCGSDSPAGKQFCGDCGAPLTIRCPKCDADNPPGKRFCGECGGSLDAPAAKPTPPKSSLAGERRHLTVLFCDLVGSTEIAAQLDPEEWRELVARYHHAAAEAIIRYGGHVAKYLGDGVMAFFGYPEAHENDAERAARAGLAILEKVSKLNQEPTNQKISVRVGIDSGAVVVGAGAGKDTDVFGEAPNIAARVQTAAVPDSVLITAATHRLLSGLFVVEPSGAQQLKGVAAPFELYRVMRPTGVRSRIAVRDLTPFVGRNEELSLLIKRWEQASEGEGQAVLVIGEPGIGKSRLVAEFHNHIRDTPHIWMESAGEQFFENTPFHGISEMLSGWLELQSCGGREEQFERLERALASAGLKVEATAPLISELLQIPVGERYPQLKLTPEEKRRRLLAALAAWALGAARLQPLVMVVEDLHWLDPSTLDSQQLLVEQGATAPLMLLYTARPEFHPPWPLRAHHTHITLNRLSACNVREMIAQVAARTALADATVDAVVERTSGVPLFVEELTRAVLESGVTNFRAGEIPVTLHDSLMARLDRLGPAKEVVQLGAVIGPEFSYELLHAVHPISEQDLQAALRSAADAELIYARGLAPDAIYQFKHALIRDAAYEALLKTRRKELHRLVARTIDDKFRDLKGEHPEVLARHWTEAGEAEMAIAQWARAGKLAESRNAFKEALDYYERALAVASTLPDSRDRSSRELELRQSVIAVLNVMKGYAAPETVEAVESAIVLAEKSGDLRKLVNLLTLRGSTLTVSGDLQGASKVLDRALEIALRDSNVANLAFVHMQQNLVRFHRGDLAGAEQHFRAWLELFKDPDLNQAVLRNGLNVAVNAFHFGSFTAWWLGRPEVACERHRQMRALAKTGGPFEVANSEYCAARFEICLRNYEQAKTLAAHALELAEKYQLPNPAARSQCWLGWAQAYLGLASEGAAMIQQGISSIREIGTRMGLSAAMSGLADAQRLAGDVRAAFETIEFALQVLPDELAYRPEALQVRGELRLEQGQTELADSDFREAIAIAGKMSAKAWQLRTTMSLARLLAQQGRREEARAMLADIYNWFTEGFDTPDLKDAKALLDELSV